MKKLISLLLVLSVILSTGCTKFNTKLDKKLSNEQWVEDIEFFSKELKSRHPNLYLNISESEFDKEIKNLKENINFLSDIEISIKLEQILSMLKDAHTNISLIEMITPPGEAKSYDNMQIFPITYKWFDDGLRVYSCDSKHKEILGLKLVSINDIELNEIIKKVSTTYSYDNNAGLKSGITKYISVYEILKFLDIVDNNSAKFVFEKENGDKYITNLDTMNFKNVNYINLSTLIKNESEISTKPTRSYDDYWFKYIEKDNILYFQYNKCINNNSSWLTDEEKRKAPDFYKFVDDLITSINSTSFDKFVIDLRNNPGGTLGLTNYLLIEL
ncbi:S41 family peptidase [Romboutsia lituseburensis]|uniref:S41 family peptidase n=1 Tax=Romboutsia lituseburensis TaxID=1537 RepID=UPI00215AC24B|nr:S41 family peptidase [Romboutsia lituseburensis]MCR8747193.1 S41 family peptidase [Romboutsia lituseburensis]